MTTLYPTTLLPVYEYMHELLKDRFERYGGARFGGMGNIDDDGFGIGSKEITGTMTHCFHGCNPTYKKVSMPTEMLDLSEEDFLNELKWAKEEYEKEKQQKRNDDAEKERRIKEEQFGRLKRELNK